MGFYGNITNTSRTQFQFDKIYPNRKEMDQNVQTDGVYLGRFVLIEYDSNYHLDTFKRVFFDNNIAYSYNQDHIIDASYKLTKGQIEQNELVYTSNSDLTPETGLTGSECVFYKCISIHVPNSTEAAVFEAISSLEGPAYTDNYNIDKITYGGGRGYDSTVWQKVYTENVEKYVMIAELNTVVPTFDVVAEAPTMNPVVPHFDTESTNVYYKLHWQAPWGFRVAEANSANVSDTRTQWTNTTYDQETGTNKTTIIGDKDAAIYFNKNAFDAQVNSKTIHKKDNNTNNEIKVVPVSSGNTIYDDHNPTTKDPVAAPDIQELTINLPAIGNMMSDAWDIIHGPNRDNARTDKNGSLQGRLDSFKDMAADEIPVKRGEDGTIIGATINGGKTSNSDLTGKNDDKWIETMVNGDIESVTIKHTFNKVNDTQTIANKNNATGDGDNKGSGDTLKLYTPKVDEMGHVVGKNTETVTLPYGFKTISVANKSESVGGVAAAAGDVVADSTQDTLTLTPGNKWIHISADKNNDKITLSHEVNNIETSSEKISDFNAEDDSICNLKIKEDTQQPNYKRWQLQDVNSLDDIKDKILKITFTGQSIDNAGERTTWLCAGKFMNANLKPIFIGSKQAVESTLASIVEGVPDNTVYFKYDSTLIGNEVEYVGGWRVIDIINIPDWEYDNAGHITEKHDHHYVLPYGFKTITTNGRSDEVSKNTNTEPTRANIVADNTQDTLNINSGNKWIRIDTDTDNDVITIRHDVHDTSSTENTTDWTKTEANTTIPTVIYTHDEAGHYMSHHTENYKLPFGYGKIVGDSGSTAATATYDELTFTSDEWLTATVEKDKVTYSHDYPKKVDDTKNESDVNGNGDTIVLETLTRDEKGHVTKVNQNTVTLPYGYKTFVGDSGATSADNTQAEMSVIGDDWVQTTVTDNNIAFAHIGPISGTATEVSAKTPDFGATFSIDDHYFDDKGHKFASKSHTVKIPSLNLTNGSGNVVTGLSLDKTDGALFTETKANIGTLTMTGYEKPTTLANQALSATESLNTTIGKLEYRLEDEAKTRENTNTALRNDLNDEINRAKAAEENALIDAKAYADNIKATLLGEGIKDTFDTLVEIQNWIEGDGVNVTELTQTITEESNRAKNEESRLNSLIETNANNIASFGTAANHPEEYFISKAQYDLDMSTKDAQINGLNFEAKRLTNELNALQEKFNSLYGIVKQLHPEAFEAE